MTSLLHSLAITVFVIAPLISALGIAVLVTAAVLIIAGFVIAVMAIGWGALEDWRDNDTIYR